MHNEYQTFKVVRRGLVAVALVGAALLPAYQDAHALQAFPNTAQLDNGRDVQRVVLLQTKDNGVTVDVTSGAAVSIEPGGVAEWTPEGLLKPSADGDASLKFTFEGAEVVVGVHVANVAVIPPIGFRNDVEPVIMRSGCNTGACHGSARGQNGFRFTLFGYDPSYDYLSLTRRERGRRVNAAVPEESLVLLKPTGAVAHAGGTRFESGSGLYETIRRWIAEGAQDDPADVPKLTGVAMVPKSVVLEAGGSKQRFIVQATYSDGTDRDVTDWAVLNSSDDLTVQFGGDGVATSQERGEAYLMARYGSFAVVSQVIVVPAETPLQWPDVAAKNFVDEHVFAKLKKLRIPPAEPCSDSAFVRRTYLDILGVLPSVDETRAFLQDANPEKRAQLIDTLLTRPEFADLWAMKWAEALQIRATPTLDRKGMHRYNDWLRQTIQANRPIDEWVRELLTGSGGNFTSPAANFYLMVDQPALMAENVAQVFFGIRLQCAQCHNHPFERWTMDDYYSFAAFFSQVGRKPSSDPRETIIFNSASGEVTNQRTGQPIGPRFLGGQDADTAGRDRRAVLAEWLAAPDNPWFAKNVANRVWAHFFGRGIIEPVDDVRVSNPPSHPELLDALALRLVSTKYDLRQLVRDICNSYTYQQSTHPRDPAADSPRNLSRASARRLSAEQLLDAVCLVTHSQVKFPALPLGARAMQVADGNSGNYFLEVFGRPSRNSACTCERSNDPTLAQTLHFINGATLQEAIRAPGGRLEQILSNSLAIPQAVEELYLAAMCRPPTEEELNRVVQYVSDVGDPKVALEDAFWSVLNAKEFIFNH